LLFAATLAYTVSFLPGESGRRLTAFFILGVVGLSVALSFFEEYRAQKELDALNKLLKFKVIVIRNSRRHAIDAAEVVPSDSLVLSHGQKVPADARVIEAHSLRTDESAFSGESIGVDKSPESIAPNAALAECTSMVFGSTYITQGTGLAVVVRTDMMTEIGQIATMLEQMAERSTPFQVEVAGAIAQAKGAGIRIIMITGDNALTARAVSRQLGIGEALRYKQVIPTELNNLSICPCLLS
jgi:Ca2+-transporting ATPase